MTGPDLNPCPFCGGSNVRAFRHVPMQPEPCVMCRDCYASAVSVAAWNTRDPAILAALPEVQALIARPLDPAPYDFDIAQLFDAVQVGGKRYVSMDSHIDLMERHSACARHAEEAEARGMVKGLREAAGICRNVRASSADESEGVGALDCASAILARAEQIESDAK